MVWAKLSSNTLTTASDTLTGDSFTTSKFIQYLGHVIPKTSNAEMFIRPNNNSNSVYANRISVNGLSDATNVTQSEINSVGDDVPIFQIIYFCNISGEEKLGIHFEASASATGAGTAPSRREQVDKFVPSPDADITSFTGVNTRAGADLDIDSNLSAIGSDGTEELNVQDGAIFYETDTNKEFLLSNNTWTEV